MVVDYPFGNTIRTQEPTTRAEAAAFLCQAAGQDGLVPTEAVAGYQFFTQSAELKKLLLARTQGQQGWFDPQRERTIIATAPPGWQITSLGKLSENRVSALFKSDTNIYSSGFFDENGNVVIPPGQYDKAADFSEGLAVVTQAGKSGFIDLSGNLVIPVQFDEAQSFYEGLAAVSVETKYGFIDTSGNLVVQPQFEASNFEFSDGLARISTGYVDWQREPQYGFIDRNGKVVVSPTFDQAEPFSEGLAAVARGQWNNTQWGYVDRNGQVAIPFDVNRRQASPFSEGLATVTTSGELGGVGVINTQGEWVIAPNHNAFTEIGPFVGGVARASLGGKVGFINRQGEFVVPPIYSDAKDAQAGYAEVQYGGVWVDYISHYNNDTPYYDTQKRGGRWGYIKLP